MDNLVLCQSCGGRKQINQLGGIYKNCSNCQGVGYISQPVSLSDDTQTNPSEGIEQPTELVNPIAEAIKQTLDSKSPILRHKSR
jgi:hypothetical protein